MCHPLVINDYASNISSPDIAYGPSLSPDIMSSSSTTSPTTTDDSWFDVCSPSLQHLTPSSYSMEQRHSFDNAMIFTKTDYGVNECCAYTCNNYTGGSRMMDPANPIHLIHPSLTSWYQPYHHQQQSMITTRHQSMPSIYQQQHDSPHSSPSDIRPYQCQICERSFARKHDLQRHIRVHTGDKPYACLCCKKAFARTDALKRHLRMEDNCRTSPQIQAMKSSGKRRYKNL
ncbi:hypothetical protein BC941DRAFT_412060 [Chlamydoabsidia padenii]|nr:hypothetical protein BC941DRAFT_412060 [Chlamydoabsidia padenii]